jgi:hypothetical protein
MKHLKKIALPLAFVTGIAFTGCGTKNEAKPSAEPLSIADKNARMAEGRKKWEASPDGVKYKEWERSAKGQKVYASHDKIRDNLKAFSDMEAVVTSVTFQRENAKPSGPKWLIVSIEGEEYMMQFIPKDFEHLKSLKVNDKIVVRSRGAGYSHNHPYLIISGDYIAKDNKILFERDFSKNKNC